MTFALIIIIAILLFCAIGQRRRILKAESEVLYCETLVENWKRITNNANQALCGAAAERDDQIKEVDRLVEVVAERDAYIEKFITPQIETEHLKAEAKLKKKRKGKK